MFSVKEIKRYQEFLLNAWPAEQYFFLNGWILRFNQGVTYRANSVFPIRYMGDPLQVEGDIQIAENAYIQYGLPCIFMMHEHFEPENLDKLLNERGYVEFDRTNALVSPLKGFRINIVNSNLEYEILNDRTDKFSDILAKHTKRDKKQQKIISHLVNRIIIPKKCFIIAKKQNEVIGTVMGVLNPQGYVYIADLFVLLDYRRSGIASSLMAKMIIDWGIPNGAKYIWLQVEKDNNPALKFYEQLGMKKAYEYYYLRKDFQE
ncbi:MAG: GNAT family N-acetyltransferase [Candidatus Thorarchaeota archaeon]